MLKSKRSYPQSTRQGVLQLPCDTKFDQCLNSVKTAKLALNVATVSCLKITAQKLATLGNLFDQADRDLVELLRDLRSGITASDFIQIGQSLRTYLTTINLDSIDFRIESSENSFIYAVMCLKDAVNNWADDKLDDAHANTVRCRAALNRLE